VDFNQVFCSVADPDPGSGLFLTPGSGILEHEVDKRLKSFAPCYSQSLLLVDFTENHTLLWF
jgi:hypothetical protein